MSVLFFMVLVAFDLAVVIVIVMEQGIYSRHGNRTITIDRNGNIRSNSTGYSQYTGNHAGTSASTENGTSSQTWR